MRIGTRLTIVLLLCVMPVLLPHDAGNRAFAEVPSTFKALEALVEASKPTSQPLTTLFTRLRPLVTTATPVVSNFHLAFSRPGPNNDLTDFANALPGLAKALSTASPPPVVKNTRFRSPGA